MNTLLAEISPPTETVLAFASGFFATRGHEPIRGELFGLDRLESHARELATVPFAMKARVRGQSLLERLYDNGRLLKGVHRRLAGSDPNEAAFNPVAEWLLDNYYVIQEVLREAQHDLPRNFYKELPRLTTGPLRGYPRIYAIALGMIAHTDSNLTEAHLVRYVQAYQSVEPLTIGELWAMPTMFRLALLENLRRLAERLLWSGSERQEAEHWFRRYSNGADAPEAALPPVASTPSKGSRPIWPHDSSIRKRWSGGKISARLPIRFRSAIRSPVCGCCRRLIGNRSSSRPALSSPFCGEIQRGSTTCRTSQHATVFARRSRSWPGVRASRKPKSRNTSSSWRRVSRLERTRQRTTSVFT